MRKAELYLSDEGLGPMLIAWVNWLLRGVCHQYASHTLHFQGQALPACARCTGTFVTAAISLLTLRLEGRHRCAGWPSRSVVMVLAILAALWGLDGFNSLLTEVMGAPWLYEPSNALRLASGVGLGLVLAVVTAPTRAQVVESEPSECQVVAHPCELARLTLAPALVSIVLYKARCLPYELVYWITVLSIFFVFGLINMTLAFLLLGSRPRVRRRKIALATALGCALTLLEMAAVATVRTLFAV